MDPLAELTHAWTPYHYVYNNPLRLVDPTGMAAEGANDEDNQTVEDMILDAWWSTPYGTNKRFYYQDGEKTKEERISDTKNSIAVSTLQFFHIMQYNAGVDAVKSWAKLDYQAYIHGHPSIETTINFEEYMYHSFDVVIMINGKAIKVEVWNHRIIKGKKIVSQYDDNVDHEIRSAGSIPRDSEYSMRLEGPDGKAVVTIYLSGESYKALKGLTRKSFYEGAINAATQYKEMSGDGRLLEYYQNKYNQIWGGKN